ncbi:MlaD family protein [Nocardia carnea]|uniref:MlaD family protein n=1 Tax=Nocardia carnea TaxID=37328 RepID=UPI002456E49B|nr:MlaD family protein [Nocardia carnea]
MKLGPLASLGGIAAITVVGASYLTFGVVRADPFRDYLNASLVLEDSGGLGVGSPVLLTGIEVGRVTSVDRVADGVEVGFRVQDSHRLPADSVVTVEHLSALGEPYVQFAPKTGAGPYISDGQRLESEDIRSPLSIPEAARMVTRTMNQLDPETMGSLVRTMSEALHGTDAVLPELTRAADLLAATIMSREPRIAELLDNFETAAADAEWAGPATSAAATEFTRFAEVLDDFVESVGRVTGAEGSPEMYLEEGGVVPLLERLRAVLDEIGPELTALQPGLAPLTDSLNSAAPQVNISSLLQQALASTDEDSVQVRVGLK